MCDFPYTVYAKNVSTSSSLLIVWLHFKFTTNLFFLITRKPIVAIKYPILVCKIKNGSPEIKNILPNQRLCIQFCRTSSMKYNINIALNLFEYK